MVAAFCVMLFILYVIMFVFVLVLLFMRVRVFFIVMRKFYILTGRHVSQSLNKKSHGPDGFIVVC